MMYHGKKVAGGSTDITKHCLKVYKKPLAASPAPVHMMFNLTLMTVAHFQRDGTPTCWLAAAVSAAAGAHPWLSS